MSGVSGHLMSSTMTLRSCLSGGQRWCLEERGVFTLVLAGGGTPRSLYELLAGSAYRERLPWGKTHFFWGDERCVPPDNKDSNYYMSHMMLLSRIDVPGENIHRIHGENGNPGAEARRYENEIRSFLRALTFVPSFDVVLLGMGPDGHTASLFPGDDLLMERKRLVAAVTAPSYMKPARRISMTLPLINNADHVMFLAAGSEKRAVLNHILMAPDADPSRPAALVRPKGRLVWFVADE